MIWNGLYKWSNVIFWITQKSLWIKASILTRWWITKERLLNIFDGPKKDWSLLFFIKMSIKRKWVQNQKIKLSFLIIFYNPFSNPIISKSFFNALALFFWAVHQNQIEVWDLVLVHIFSIFLYTFSSCNTFSIEHVSLSDLLYISR